MTRYRTDVRTECGHVFRWRLRHEKLRTAKKRRGRWLRTNGRIWDVRSAGEHNNCMHLAQRPAEYAVRLEGWRKLGPLRYFGSMWDAYPLLPEAEPSEGAATTKEGAER